MVSWRQALFLFQSLSICSSLSFNVQDTVQCRNLKKDESRAYDLVIIGAGASGLFASGAAQLVGMKRTCLVTQNIGGDCSNYACVPSKALRSVVARHQRIEWDQAMDHVQKTVLAVQARENPTRIRQQVDLKIVQSCRFQSPQKLEIELPENGSGVKTLEVITAKKFLIATGASPVIPDNLEAQAKQAGLSIDTYRTIYGLNNASRAKQHLLMIGGGATACELGQALARIKGKRITMVAPDILPALDIRLRQAAWDILKRDGIECIIGERVVEIQESKVVVTDKGKEIGPVDGILLFTGRSPNESLRSLDLENAHVKWDEDKGIHVDRLTLRSISSRRVYASGDCASVVAGHDRTATQGAWTGFHAVRNMVLPRLLTHGSHTVHPTVPKVVYTDPQLAQVGLSYADCVEKYEKNGFDVVFCPEEGSDLADMDRGVRSLCGFVELRAHRTTGRILGGTVCGPAAAEIGNTIGLAIINKLTTTNVAKSIFSYPSHGYLFHRVALSMSLSTAGGLLEASLGRTGLLLSFFYRTVRRIVAIFAAPLALFMPREKQHSRTWQATGARNYVVEDTNFPTTGQATMHSYLSLWNNETLRNELGLAKANTTNSREETKHFRSWMQEGSAPWNPLSGLRHCFRRTF